MFESLDLDLDLELNSESRLNSDTILPKHLQINYWPLPSLPQKRERIYAIVCHRTAELSAM